MAVIVGGGILGYYYSWIKELDVRLAEIESQLLAVKPSEEVTPEEKAEDETPGVKTFKILDRDDFSIKCPANWECEGSSLSGEIGNSEEWFYRLARVDIYAYENYTQTLDEWTSEWTESENLIKIEDIVINNKIAKKIWLSGAPYEGGTSFEGGRTIAVFYTDGNKRALLHGWVYNADNLNEFNNVFTEIVSTFKFLE